MKTAHYIVLRRLFFSVILMYDFTAMFNITFQLSLLIFKSAVCFTIKTSKDMFCGLNLS